MQYDRYDHDALDVDESVRERHRTAAEPIRDEPYGHLIGGEFVAGERGETARVCDATTGAVLGRVQVGSPADVDRAVEAARDAVEGRWGEVHPRRRAELLEDVIERFEERKATIAKLDSLEMGKPNKHSMLVDMTIASDQLRYFAAVARSHDAGRVVPADAEKHVYTRFEPYGVVGAITAWNFPALFVTWKAGPALAAGNSVVIKPSSRSTLSTLELARCFDDVLPDGTVNVVTGTGGTVGAAIAGHEGIDKLTLTGSTGAGASAMAAASDSITPVSLELGGKNPLIVFPDADLEAAVEGAAVGLCFNAGQQCIAASRLYVHAEVREEFLALFADRLDELAVGDPLSPLTDVGPLVDHDHRESVREHVETAVAQGATVHYRGETPWEDPDHELAGAPLHPPVVLTDVSDEDAIAREEVFGPVATVHEWTDREDVIRRANDTPYGLVAGIWTTDLETAHEVAAALEVGTVWVNNYGDLLEPAPHGGFKDSGIGRELAVEAMESYRQVKTVNVTLGDPLSL